MLAAKVPSTQTVPVTDSCASKSNIEQKENNANESIAASKQVPLASTIAAVAKPAVTVKPEKIVKVVKASTSASTGAVVNSATNTNTTTNTNSNTNTNTNMNNQRKLYYAVNKHLSECSYGMCKDCDEIRGRKPATKAQPISMTAAISDSTMASVRRASFCPMSPMETASLDDILEFIEGNGCNKKDSQKKAAKKAKQKQKKEDVKKIEDLEQLRDEFHDLYFKEYDAKSELKVLKGAKKRDKKKVLEGENNVKKLGKVKTKVESSILELITVLKKNNSDFKFAYLPTKEQQLQKQSEAAISPTPAPTQKNVAQVNSASIEVKQPFPVKNQAHAVLADGQPSQNCEISLDPSKRMVTIRRVNLPHSEPQVTVTARGSSPEEDRLLYRFINGQLVPGKHLIYFVMYGIAINIPI